MHWVMIETLFEGNSKPGIYNAEWNAENLFQRYLFFAVFMLMVWKNTI